ncbi:MAG: hypothetical protein AAGH57_14775 [Pseudomonadota bacterium]
MTRALSLTLMCGLALSACDSGPIIGGDNGSIPPIPAYMGPGLYALGDGTQIHLRRRLFEDGTYTDLNNAMEPAGGGTWRTAGGPGDICFDPEGDGPDQEESCWQNDGPEKDRSFTSSRVGGGGFYRVAPLEE